MVVVDARRMLVAHRISLRGDFGFDAVAPDGSRLYLVNYLGADETHYAVRAFDVRNGRLAGGPIVDAREPDEKMVGLPVTRATSRDGRWAYTLYDDSGGSHPFVHALDSLAGKAYCVDLDALAGRGDLMALRLRLDRSGRTLSVVLGRDAQALIDTATLAVRPPGSAPPRAAAAAPGSTGGGTPWALVGAGAVLLTALAAAAVRIARPRVGASTGRP
jgi:hypothetical protein